MMIEWISAQPALFLALSWCLTINRRNARHCRLLTMVWYGRIMCVALIAWILPIGLGPFKVFYLHYSPLLVRSIWRIWFKRKKLSKEAENLNQKVTNLLV